LIEVLPRGDSSAALRGWSAPPFLQRWFARYARRRLRKELEHYMRPPEIKLSAFRRRNARGGAQVFRSLVQVNVYRDDRR
jgi:hypothetical protein